MTRKIAGVDYRDLQRLSDGVSLSLGAEVVEYVRRVSSRRGARVAIETVLDDVVQLTGASPGEVQTAFDIVYRDHRLSIDKDGFVKLVDGRKARAAMLKGAPANVMDEDIWDKAKESVGPDDGSYDSYWAVVMDVYKNMGGRTSGSDDKESRAVFMVAMISKLGTPLWVQDGEIWKKAVLSISPTDPVYWGKVIVAYRKAGGRVVEVNNRKSAEFQPRPFDVHSPVWTVKNDGMLSRDLATIQGFIASGISPEQLESEMVDAGAERSQARMLITEAINSEILI